MITLDDYKKYLLNNIRDAYDDTPEKYQERAMHLKNSYPDSMLNKILEDTLSFARDIVNNANYGYWKLDVDEEKVGEVNLFLCGGYYSDTIFEDNAARQISKYILKTIFGRQFNIDIYHDRFDIESDDPNIMSVYYRFYLYMQGIPKDLDEIKKELFKDEKRYNKKP